MKKVLVLVLVIAMHIASNAIQLPQVSHFTYDYLRINPGSAGSMDMVCLNGILRQQMVGFPKNPESFFFEAEAPFSLFGAQHGVGLSVYRDAIGFNTDINLHLTYAFRFNVGDGSLGIGIEAGFVDNTIEGYEWVTSDGSAVDEYIPQGDPEGMTLTMGAGIFYRTDDIYFGVSALHLNNPEVTTISTDPGNYETIYNLDRHYYVTAGYNMQLSNPAWELKPAVLLKSDSRETDMDLNLTCMYNKKIWGGVTYRTGEAVVGMIGIELFEGFKVGYSYDVQTSALIKYNQGSHEFVLNYCFKIGVEKAPQKYKSIRFL